MFRMNSKSTAILGSMILVLGIAGACNKGGGGGGGKGDTAGVTSSGSFALPKETGFVMGFSVSKLRSTKLWDTITKKAMENGEFKSGMDEVKADCGIDAMADIESVVVSGPETMAEEKMLIMVKGKFDEKKINDCFVKMALKKDNKKATVTKDGKVSVYQVEGDEKKLHA